MSKRREEPARREVTAKEISLREILSLAFIWGG
jgi:hypothetical protein